VRASCSCHGLSPAGHEAGRGFAAGVEIVSTFSCLDPADTNASKDFRTISMFASDIIYPLDSASRSAAARASSMPE
jgi:hypothetical protein